MSHAEAELGHFDTLFLGSALSRLHRIAVFPALCQHPHPLRPLRVQLSQRESQERGGKALGSHFGKDSLRPEGDVALATEGGWLATPLGVD